ncbi:hypothetical protein [Planctomycetes bacterium Pla133]
METLRIPLAAKQQYAKAHAEHYGEHDLLAALRDYEQVIVVYPESPEAHYARRQILCIVNRVVPEQELRLAQEALAENALALQDLQRERDAAAIANPS